jgi:PAS domain S-box-containing protein
MISVLYVDDEPLFLDLGKRFLEQSGKIQVDTFLSADLAIKVLPISLYDAIISDYQMPGMDGIAFLKTIRQNHPDIPFIVYTGKGGEEIAIQALNQGADFYLQKGGSPKIQYGEIENFIINMVNREHQKGRLKIEKRKAEESLSLLQTLYVFAPFGFAFVDPNMIFVHVNDAMAEISRIPRSDHLGRSMHEVNPVLWSKVEAEISRVLDTGRPVLDYEMNESPGFESESARNWLMNFYPVRTPGDTILGVGILVVDISTRKLMEQALSSSEERYRTLAESAVDCIFIVGRDERLVYINSSGSDLLNRNPEELIGMATNDICSDLYLLIHQDGLQKVFETGQKCSYDAEIPGYEGKRWVEVLLIPMPGYTGPLGQILGIGRDVTRRIRAESGLVQANRKLNLLSSITRHDIINQLSLLFLYLDDLNTYAIDEKGQEIYDRINQSIHSIHHQIEFTRQYQEIGVAAPIWQNLHKLIEQAVSALPIGRIEIYEDDTGVEILADSLFEKVIYNLIDNAIRYGGKVTQIRWNFTSSEDGTLLVVEDDGFGVPPENKEDIFAFGFGNNTGFGLFMVREILSITHATIIETGTLYVGARFEILFPPGYVRILSS